MKKVNCYIYTRVSTAMQVDGYSLDAQREKLRKYADFQELHIAGEYSDEGKSGKNIANRPQFQQMLQDIETGKDDVSFVLVFKLSRFGRNAADVLSSLQFMQDYGVNLICVEDSIDSSRDSGKLMISVLSAVAEIERENILVQTMAGRKQKAKEGKWNGGFAPYGYYLEKGELKIAEDEAEVIRVIFDQYVHTTMGVHALAKYLNQSGYIKKQRQNGTLDMFSASFVKFVLDNPIYCGRVAFGRRKTEKINGERNQYHIVKQTDYPVYDGIHEAIVSEELWQLAQEKRKENSGKWEKKYNLDHEHLLSGILCCPVCGAKMYGNVNRKKKPDGTIYKDHFYYACKHRLQVDGHRCDYHRQWNQDVINAAVEEVIHKAVNQPQFETAVKEQFNSEVDTHELENKLTDLKKQLRQQIGAKDRLSYQADQLDVSDRHYERKYRDIEKRMDAFYDEIERIEDEIESVQHQIAVIREQKITAENIYEFLYLYDIIYQKMTDAEKKRFLNSFLESVEIFPEKQPDGKILKSISFRFPIIYDGESTTKIDWDKKSQVELVVLMSRAGS